MTLKELIQFLEERNPEDIVALGFANPHSYRKYYTELAFEPERNVTVGYMLKEALKAVRTTFEGWQGGDYTMYPNTEVWLAYEGHVGKPISPFMLSLLLDEDPLQYLEIE